MGMLGSPLDYCNSLIIVACDVTFLLLTIKRWYGMPKNPERSDGKVLAMVKNVKIMTIKLRS